MVLTELVCLRCRQPFAVYRPSRDLIEHPICPDCLVSADGAADFIKRLSREIYGKKREVEQ